MILMVIKKDGGREAFDRSKLLNGIIRACEKRSCLHRRNGENRR